MLQLHAGLNSLHADVLTLFSARLASSFFPPSIWVESEIKKCIYHPSPFREKCKNQSQLASLYGISDSVPVLGFQTSTEFHGDNIPSCTEASNNFRRTTGRSLHNPLLRDRTEGRGAAGFEKSFDLGLRSAGRVQTTPCSTACVGSTRENESDGVFTARWAAEAFVADER